MRTIGAAVLCAALFGPAVHAEITFFTNPAPGEPGHYAWLSRLEEPGWLDITLPAAAQANTETGSSIAQGITAGFPGGMPDLCVLIGGDFNRPGPWSSFAVADDDDAFVQALSHGDTLAGLRYDSWALCSYGIPPNVRSLFPEGERRYIGVRTADGRYGWVEIARSGQGLSAFTWACETQPGVPIFAGQVPAPAAAALLGVASTLHLCRRRRARPGPQSPRGKPQPRL